MIYKRDTSPHWVIEFTFRGKRYRKSSGTSNKAKAIERRWRKELEDYFLLDLEFAAESPAFHTGLQCDEDTLTRCPPNRQQATHHRFSFLQSVARTDMPSWPEGMDAEA